MTSKLSVGFPFINDGADWHGGLNYFRSLFLSLQSLPECTIEPIAFVGIRADVSRYKLPANVRVMRDAVFDRFSVKWALNKVMTRFVGAPLLANRVFRRHGVAIISHSVPTGDAALKTIGWIPDFQYLHLPHFFSAKELAGRSNHDRTLVERCDVIVVSSEAARRDLERFAPHFAEKARVLRFCAVQPDLQAGASLDLHAAYDFDGPYFYLPNQAWAHKNHVVAIEALAQLKDEFPDLRIVCSGSLRDYRNPAHLEALRARIARHGLEERFRLLGLVPYPHIAQLMLRSVAVINPSLFEGWSTTVEEAKSLGVSLILSNIDVHREQCDEDQASFFEPEDSVALADRMRSMLALERGRSQQRNLQGALERHRWRTREFARTYQAIIVELASSVDGA